MTPRLLMRGIEKSFGGVQALRGVDLIAQPGEILGLCGENGAGKSTLLKVLSGVHPHGSFRGEIEIDGASCRFGSTREAMRAGVAIVHQELMLVPELSVADNLFLGREPGRSFAPGLLDGVKMEEAARALLSRFSFGSAIDPGCKVKQLGVGLRQIVEIVRALSLSARVLVLDEPTSALTSSESTQLLSLLRELRQAGTTCIYVSHRLDEIFAVCQRVTVLRDGRNVGTLQIEAGAPARIKEVVSMMVGKEVEVPSRPTRGHGLGKILLDVRGLTMHPFGASGPALRDLSFQVAAGEVVAVCGAMGSGRSALLSSLFGLARGRKTGQILLAERPLLVSGPREAIDAGIALVPEDRKGQGLVLPMTVQENLSLPAAGGALNDEVQDEVRARARIRELSIRGAPDTTVAALSGGNQQKVAIGKWLERPPALLLLDEPTRGVDVGAREEIYGIVEGLCERGVAVLLASSDLQEVRRLAHRVLVLRGGAIAGILMGEEITESAILSLSLGAGDQRGAA